MRSDLRRRVVEIAPPAGRRTYVGDDDDVHEDDAGPAPVSQRPNMASGLDAISAELGCTRQRVQQIEAVALEKLKHAFELEARLGPVAAAPVLARLRGKPIAAFREALEKDVPSLSLSLSSNRLSKSLSISLSANREQSEERDDPLPAEDDDGERRPGPNSLAQSKLSAR